MKKLLEKNGCPLTLPSPSRGEGKGEGDLWIRMVSLFLLFSVCNACGGGTFSGEKGSLALIVKESPGIPTKNERGRVSTYRITVQGEDFEPIVHEFSAGATEAVIDGIPVGKNRQVIVEGYNPWGQRIRETESGPVEVQGGRSSAVDAELSTVPIFMNLAEGAVIENTRFAFQILTEPDSLVVVEEVFAEEGAKGIDLGLSAVPADGEGEIQATPLQTLTPGPHQFIVRDLYTNRFSIVTVKLLDGGRRQGAPFVSAGFVGSKGCGAAGFGVACGQEGR